MDTIILFEKPNMLKRTGKRTNARNDTLTQNLKYYGVPSKQPGRLLIHNIFDMAGRSYWGTFFPL